MVLATRKVRVLNARRQAFQYEQNLFISSLKGLIIFIAFNYSFVCFSVLHENYDIFYTFWKLIEDSTLMVGNSREFTSELRSEASLTMMCILKMDANDYNVVLERNYANYFARILSTGPYRLRREVRDTTAVFLVSIFHQIPV